MSTELLFTGDLILDEPNPDHWLSGIAPTMRQAHIVIGHLEVPHTARAEERLGDIPAPAAEPAHIAALERAGFTAVTLAGNHIADCGANGINDTIALLDAAHVAHTGAGPSHAKAISPALLVHERNTVALLAYNCVGPENSWATDTRAGCAYLRVETTTGVPIAPSAPLERADPTSLALMASDIAAAKGKANFVVVALHKGIVHTPARLAPYERAVAHAAIDAGADAVIGHHAHIVRGIEIYRGKPIFHGLGNGCVVTRALSPYRPGESSDTSRGSKEAQAARSAWAIKRRELFGFNPDPTYTLAPFHPEAVNGMLGRVSFDGHRSKVGFVPVFVEAPGRPTIAQGQRADEVIAYIERITVNAGLTPIKFQYDGEVAWLT